MVNNHIGYAPYHPRGYGQGVPAVGYPAVPPSQPYPQQTAVGSFHGGQAARDGAPGPLPPVVRGDTAPLHGSSGTADAAGAARAPAVLIPRTVVAGRRCVAA